MSFFDRLFKKNQPAIIDCHKKSGDLVSEFSGENLIDVKETWECAHEKKDDIEYMKQCCDAELKTMETVGLVPAPYYFERVAVLSRRAKDYQQEIRYCEMYVCAVKSYYAKHGTQGVADVRKSPRYAAIVARPPKAKELFAKSRKNI